MYNEEKKEDRDQNTLEFFTFSSSLFTKNNKV